MFSSPMKTRRTPALRRLLDEIRDLVAERIDLDGEAEVHAFIFRISIRRSKSGSQSRVAGEIVVGDEEAVDALRLVLAQDAFEIVGVAEAALAPLDIDDGAEGALIGAAAPEIEARQFAHGAAHAGARQDRQGLAFERGQLVEIIVERLKLVLESVPQKTVEAMVFRFAGEKRHAQGLSLADFRRQFGEHGKAAGHMEAADPDLKPIGAEPARKIESAGKLVRLHPDQANHAVAAGLADHGGDFLAAGCGYSSRQKCGGAARHRGRGFCAVQRPARGHTGRRAYWMGWRSEAIGSDSPGHRNAWA